jgi:hypothetical protein
VAGKAAFDRGKRGFGARAVRAATLSEVGPPAAEPIGERAHTSIMAANPAMNRPMVSCARPSLVPRSAAMPRSDGR